MEVFGGEGEAVISDLIFPSNSSDGLSLEVFGGGATLQSAEVSTVSRTIPQIMVVCEDSRILCVNNQ